MSGAASRVADACRRFIAGPWQMRLTPPPPRAGIEVTAGGLRSRLRRPAGADDARLPLPASLTRLDGLHPNAADDRTLAAELEPLLAGLPAGPIALLLPTRYFRAFTLDFESMPRGARELDSMLRFRLKRLLPYKPEAARLSFRLISPRPARLFVLAGYDPVLRQWESALAACRRPAGWLLPASLASLASLAPTGGDGVDLLIDGDADGVNLLAAQAGMPVLLRSKPVLAGETANGLASREATLTAAYLRERLHLPRLLSAASRGLPPEPGAPGDALAGALLELGCGGSAVAPAPLDWIAPDPALTREAA